MLLPKCQLSIFAACLYPCGVFIRYLLCWVIKRAGPTADRLAPLTLLKMTYQITQRTGIRPCLWFFKYHPTFWEDAAHNSVKIARQLCWWWWWWGGGGRWCSGCIYQLPVARCTRNTRDKHLICPPDKHLYIHLLPEQRQREKSHVLGVNIG